VGLRVEAPYVRPKVYTSPSCPLCDALKDALRKLKVDFEELDVSDAEVMADLIMRDIYLDSTPALEVGGRVWRAEELFKGGAVDLSLLKEALRAGK
jgi:glutaredoxin